jgi:hypothetical protein
MRSRFPRCRSGFEIETELTVHALELRMPHAELDTAYSTRPEGSHSKLSTYRDGWRILKTICKLFISERPLQFFSIIAGCLLLSAIALAIPLLLTYMHTGLVPRLPTAVLATGAMLAAMLSMVCGVVMHAVTLGRARPSACATWRFRACATTPPGDEVGAGVPVVRRGRRGGFRGRRGGAVPAGAAAGLVRRAGAVFPGGRNGHLGLNRRYTFNGANRPRPRCCASTSATL